MLSLNATIWIIFAGVSCAMLYAWFNGKILGDFVQALNKKNAENAETARTLRELGFGKFYAFVIKLSAEKGSSLRRFVNLVYPTEDENGEKIKNLPEQRYYLVQEKKETALHRYDNKGVNLVTVVICLAIMAAAAAIFTVATPYLTRMLDREPNSDYENELFEDYRSEQQEKTADADNQPGDTSAPDEQPSDIPTSQDGEKAQTSEEEADLNRFETAQ